MLKFSDKGSAEVRFYTVAFNRNMDADATITDAEVTVNVYEFSDVGANSPEDLLVGSPVINSTETTIGGETVPVAQAISQKLQGGTVGTTYVISFHATLSTGEELIEQVLLKISEYVPV